MFDAWGPARCAFIPVVCLLVSEAAEAGQGVPDLNPLGALATTLCWLMLVALNLWCFTRLLSGPKRGPRAAPAAQAGPASQP